MRYMLLLYVADRPEPGTEEAAAAFDAIRAFHADLRARGALVASDPLHRPEAATTVRVRDGETLNVDGPFAETTEWLGGYFVVDCAGLDEALELAARCPTAHTGSVEVRPIIDIVAR
jgi:hypothetical protein